MAIYTISIAIALSPLGEVLLRYIQGVRLIYTSKEAEYLNPIFEKVYEQAKAVDKHLNKNIQLYLVDEMHVNVFAVGTNTIILTKGIALTLTKEQLKGIIGHELGHNI